MDVLQEGSELRSYAKVNETMRTHRNESDYNRIIPDTRLGAKKLKFFREMEAGNVKNE